jgi:hypothetical protein
MIPAEWSGLTVILPRRHGLAGYGRCPYGVRVGPVAKYRGERYDPAKSLLYRRLLLEMMGRDLRALWR